MDLRQLDNVLKEMMGPSDAHKTMDKISHWIDRLKFEKKYDTAIASEVKALKNLENLGLVKVVEKGLAVEAELTDAALEVHKEMVARGFFLKKGKV